VDQAVALGVLVALSRGESVPHRDVIEAGRVAADALLRGGTRRLIYLEEPGFRAWNLERISDDEAATLAARLARQLPELMKDRQE
jgi:hypothetical protein